MGVVVAIFSEDLFFIVLCRNLNNNAKGNKLAKDSRTEMRQDIDFDKLICLPCIKSFLNLQILRFDSFFRKSMI